MLALPLLHPHSLSFCCFQSFAVCVSRSLSLSSLFISLSLSHSLSLSLHLSLSHTRTRSLSLSLFLFLLTGVGAQKGVTTHNPLLPRQPVHLRRVAPQHQCIDEQSKEVGESSEAMTSVVERASHGVGS